MFRVGVGVGVGESSRRWCVQDAFARDSAQLLGRRHTHTSENMFQCFQTTCVLVLAAAIAVSAVHIAVT